MSSSVRGSEPSNFWDCHKHHPLSHTAINNMFISKIFNKLPSNHCGDSVSAFTTVVHVQSQRKAELHFFSLPAQLRGCQYFKLFRLTSQWFSNATGQIVKWISRNSLPNPWLQRLIKCPMIWAMEITVSFTLAADWFSKSL